MLSTFYEYLFQSIHQLSYHWKYIINKQKENECILDGKSFATDMRKAIENKKSKIPIFWGMAQNLFSS